MVVEELRFGTSVTEDMTLLHPHKRGSAKLDDQGSCELSSSLSPQVILWFCPEQLGFPEQGGL